jgi:hypothetical protein
MPPRLHLGRNGPQRPPLTLHGDHLADGLLLGIVRHQLAVVAQPVAERDRASEKAPLAFCSAFTWEMRSRMRSRSASANAAAMVKNNLLTQAGFDHLRATGPPIA